ncbi:MAG: hypothetical protein JRI37_13570 [Deltaproteobacteria bacterium]|nr:hypothetical protein [Deltaproteobacteria bacterium]
MKKLTGSQLVSEFIQRLRALPNCNVTSSSISRNVFRLSGNFDSLIYVKGRAEEPHRWGVTKNVVKRLEDQEIPWFVILIFNTPETGYLLSQSNVRSYISSVWPLGSDGDYKTAPGAYLSKNAPFHSINIFTDQLEGLMAT